MACTRCEEDARKAERIEAAKAQAAAEQTTLPADGPPFNASDLMVVDQQSVRSFEPSDWPADKHKLLILLPEAFTPTCTDQIKNIKVWYDEFAKLDCELIMVGSDSPHALLDWFNSEPTLHNRPFKAFSSYLLPARLALVAGGRAKRAAVFVLADGTVTKQEAFEKVAPSFEELHRVLWAHTTGNHCGCDWKSPADGFLTPA